MTTIKKGSTGSDVKTLQNKLALKADGVFGPATEAAVITFQKNNGLVADGIVGAKTWAKLGVTVGTSVQTARKITKIILHCSATPKGEDFSVETIRQWHLQRGFNDIGYHYVVGLDGKIYKGRDEALAGAHTTGQNANSIGICYIGGCPARTDKNWAMKGEDTRTPEQKKALVEIVKEMLRKYPGATVHGHREFAQKACPSFDVQKEIETFMN